ncbi:MAG: nucleotidyltransferase domain-containing protein [Kiritimatiellia bacterium]|jgi:predicted nucleotidyltransferase
MNTLAQLFCSRVRAEVFCLLFGASSNSIHLREIQRRAGFSLGAVRQDIEKLTALGIVLRRKDGNRVYYAANECHPLFTEIRGLVLKTCGLADVLGKALKGKGVYCAFVFGSIAQGTATPESDVDLMVVGDIGLRKITGLLAGVGNQLGREINPHVLSAAEFSKRLKTREHFLVSVVASPRIWIVGSENDLKAMGR